MGGIEVKDILKGIIELLEEDYGHNYTECGSDFDEKMCNANNCSQYSACKSKEKQVERFEKIKQQVNEL